MSLRIVRITRGERVDEAKGSAAGDSGGAVCSDDPQPLTRPVAAAPPISANTCLRLSLDRLVRIWSPD